MLIVVAFPLPFRVPHATDAEPERIFLTNKVPRAAYGTHGAVPRSAEEIANEHAL